MAELAPRTPVTVLIVEDNKDIAELFRRLVSRDLQPSHIYQAETLQLAQHILRTVPIDMMLIDPGLPDSFGLHTIQTLMELSPRTAAAVITGYINAADKTAALARGVVGYYDKDGLIEYWRDIQLIRQLQAQVDSSHG